MLLRTRSCKWRLREPARHSLSSFVSVNAIADLGLGKSASRGADRTRVRATLKSSIGFLVAILGWEAVRRGGLVDPRDLPSVMDIVARTGKELVEGPLFEAVANTSASWLPGLFIATAIGVIAGVALALSPVLESTVRPILEFIRPIPSVALIPIALITLGLSARMQLTLIAFASVWPVLFSTKAGVESTDPRHTETGCIFGLGHLERIWRIVLPTALPSIATGVRTAAAIALVLAITVEMITGRPGIGAYLQLARLNGQPVEMWSAVLITAILGYGVNSVFLLMERTLLPWSPEHRDRV